jgi:DNA polymerase (family X)
LRIWAGNLDVMTADSGDVGRYNDRMNRNDEIAAQFDEIADRMSLLGESWFKIRAYRKAVETMRATSEDIALLSAEGRLDGLEGIGEAITEKTADYLATGHIPLLDRLREQVPDGRVALMRAGLTPAQVREIADKLGVETPEALRDSLARGAEGLSAKTRSAAVGAVGT